jgi:two-component system response regulator
MQKILLVENSISDAVLLRRVLKAVNVLNPVIYVSDGAEAMSCLEQVEKKAGSDASAVPGILFLDLNVPTVSCVEILTHLQGRTLFSEMLTIVMGDPADKANLRAAYTLGAKTFVAKPINAAEVRGPINDYPAHWELKKTEPSVPALK